MNAGLAAVLIVAGGVAACVGFMLGSWAMAGM